jgi:glycosyltransferase involved in cell wall biosynthesis
MARIGISAVALDPNRTGGAETYIRQLLGCPAFHHALRHHEVVVFVGRSCDPVLTHCGFRLVHCPTSPVNRLRRLLWEQYGLPRILTQQRLDLLHFPYSGFSWAYDKPLVVTVHDTTNFVMPKSVSLLERIYRAVLQKKLIYHPHAYVITASKTDGAVFASRLNLPLDRCFSVYHGYSEHFLIPRELTGIPRPNGGLLWVGRPYHHKNVDLLLYMAAELFRTMGSKAPRLRLVGIPSSAKGRFEDLAQRLSILPLVDITPPLPHATLPAVLRQAQILVYPSTYESFGLPPLEAMCSGTPVVCADIPVFRETLENATVYADPFRPDSFAKACASLLQDQDAWIKQARQGHEHVQRFTWSRCALETAAVYERALRSSHAWH